MNDILVNLADNYPQAQASGGTPRMREVITEVNRVDDEQNDLIFANSLKIKEHLDVKMEYSMEQVKLGDEGDYTQFIMQVVNKIIRVTQSN